MEFDTTHQIRFVIDPSWSSCGRVALPDHWDAVCTEESEVNGDPDDGRLTCIMHQECLTVLERAFEVANLDSLGANSNDTRYLLIIAALQRMGREPSYGFYNDNDCIVDETNFPGLTGVDRDTAFPLGIMCSKYMWPHLHGAIPDASTCSSAAYSTDYIGSTFVATANPSKVGTIYRAFGKAIKEGDAGNTGVEAASSSASAGIGPAGILHSLVSPLGQSYDTFRRLPAEILVEILNLLPLQSLRNLRLASRHVASFLMPSELPEKYWKAQFMAGGEFEFVYEAREDPPNMNAYREHYAEAGRASPAAHELQPRDWKKLHRLIVHLLEPYSTAEKPRASDFTPVPEDLGFRLPRSRGLVNRRRIWDVAKQIAREAGKLLEEWDWTVGEPERTARRSITAPAAAPSTDPDISLVPNNSAPLDDGSGGLVTTDTANQ